MTAVSSAFPLTMEDSWSRLVEQKMEVHYSPAVAQVFQQQVATKPKIEWSSGLCDCFEDASTCCYGFWCCPCLACTVSDRFGENRCLPLCDICSYTVMLPYGVAFCVPPAALSLRVAMRNRYDIKGSLCKDIAASCFCSCCSWCQMHRELKHRKKTPTVIYVQNQPIVQMQPAPVMGALGYPPQADFVSQPEDALKSH